MVLKNRLIASGVVGLLAMLILTTDPFASDLVGSFSICGVRRVDRIGEISLEDPFWTFGL